MPPSLAGQTIWITGASSGIGRALALAYARRGANVAISARREDRLAEVAREIEARGGRALVLPCDVTREERVAGAVEALMARFGRLDVAVANAGYAVKGRVERLTAADWRRQLDVNVVGVAVTARHAIPHLRATRGRLALVASVAGMIPAPGAGAYSASKAAVRAMGQALAVELHGSGVSCTTIFPGFVESEIGQVDNEGIFRPDDRDRLPGRLTWPTDRAARVMMTAIARREREFVFTGHGRFAGFLGRHMPGFLHFAITRSSRYTLRADRGG
jgi:NAD(P)-dependent dehydrogenase (short-subunit alcohol dehydrogenase family)